MVRSESDKISIYLPMLDRLLCCAEKLNKTGHMEGICLFPYAPDGGLGMGQDIFVGILILIVLAAGIWCWHVDRGNKDN